MREIKFSVDLDNYSANIVNLKHTKDTAKAKPWVAPLGTSGMYMTDEVCKHSDKLWRSKQDNNPYEPGATGTDDFWEAIT